MPWWIWLLLALFMLSMIVAGCIYVVLHGYHAFKDIAQVGSRAGERFAAMGDTLPVEQANSAPFFTRPLRDAADRYVDPTSKKHPVWQTKPDFRTMEQ